MKDVTQPLMRWIAGNDIPRRVIIACPSVLTGGLKRSDVVVRLDHCVDHYDAGLVAQLLAAGVTELAFLKHCASCTALSDLFPSVKVIAPTKPRFQMNLFRPTELVMGQIELPRRTVLGLGAATELPFNVRASEDDRVLASFRILKEKGLLGKGGISGKALSLEFDGCIACGVCVRSCTYSALALERFEGVSTLVYDASACRGALDCVRLCPQGAISVASALDWTQIVATKPQVVASVQTRHCDRCQVAHPDIDEKYCETCRALQTNVFGTNVDVEELKRRAKEYRRSAKIPE